MADNTTLNPGTAGDVIATDDIGGIKFQRIKLIHGNDNTNDGDISNTNPFPVKYPTITPTDKSGTITTGNTAQQLAAANASRKGYWIQNNSTGDLWLSDLTTAVMSQPSLKLVAGAYYESPLHGCSGSALSIIGATTGQSFSAREW
jgi:hypothetical protein